MQKYKSLMIIALMLATSVSVLAAPVCAPSYTVIGNNCAFEVHAGWGTAGLGTDSILAFYVPPSASGPISFQFTAINSTLGNTYSGYMALLIGEPGKPGTILVSNQNVNTNIVTVNPGALQGFIVEQVCWDPTCTLPAPAGAVPNAYNLAALMLSPVSADLDLAPFPLLTIQFLNAGGQVTGEESENWGHLGRSVFYVPEINEGATPAVRYVQNGSAGYTEPFHTLTITNTSGAPISGTATIVDHHGNMVLSAAIPSIPPSGSAGFLLTGRFTGDNLGLFPSSTVLPAGSDNVFHGTLVVTMTGRSVTAVQEFISNSILNMVVD